MRSLDKLAYMLKPLWFAKYYLLLTLWPIFAFVANNTNSLTSSFELYYLWVLICLPIIWLLFAVPFIQRWHSIFLLPSFLLVAMFFQYLPIKAQLAPLVGLTGIKASPLWVLLTLSTGILSFWISVRLLIVRKAIEMVILAVFCLSALTLISQMYFGEMPEDNIHTSLDKPVVFTSKPNIYFFMADGYARDDVLKDYFQLDNHSFIEQLSALGFTTAKEAYSNYDCTIPSFASMFNMQLYPMRIPSKEIMAHARGQNKVTSILKDNGYKIVKFPSHWLDLSCYGNEDLCMKSSSVDIIDSFFAQTPFHNIYAYVSKWVGGHSPYVNFDQVKTYVTQMDKKSQYVFVHFDHVHDGAYDDECQIYTKIRFPNLKLKADLYRYAQSIRCFNRKLIDVVEHVRKHDPNAIILIQADHGPNFYYSDNKVPHIKNAETIRRQYGILSAIYMPKSTIAQPPLDYFAKKPHAVNVFNYIFSYLAGIELPKAPEEAYYIFGLSGDKQYFEFVDVTGFKRDYENTTDS